MQRPLLELLGARWAMGSPVRAAAWNGEGAGFALADGTLALAPGHWAGGPRIATRPEGGIALLPAEQTPGPVSRLAVHRGACRCIAAAPGGGFVVADAAGALAWVGADGALIPSAEQPAHDLSEPPASLAAHAGLLALGTQGSVVVMGNGAAPRRLVADGTPALLAWSGDGKSLAGWSARDGLMVWQVADGACVALAGCPAPPLGLAFLDGGRLLVAGGGTRPKLWRCDPPLPGAGPVEAGLAGKAQVSAVAGHPGRALFAAGYATGAVLLCPAQGADMLFLRGPGGGGVTALAWSSDGERLALGTEDGEIGVLALPAALFRPQQAEVAA